MAQVSYTVKGTLRTLRTIHIALVIAMILYTWIALTVLHPDEHGIDRAFFEGIAIVALVAAVIAFAVRKRMLQPVSAMLQANPADPAPHARWRQASIISYALALSIVLFGLALRSVGAEISQMAPFFIAGFVLMLLWYPRHP